LAAGRKIPALVNDSMNYIRKNPAQKLRVLIWSLLGLRKPICGMRCQLSGERSKEL
jgi:hypothetical protein